MPQAAGNSHIVLTNGASSSNVFWQVGSSATLGTGSVFKGTIIAYSSITSTTSATVDGRLIALNGAVTLIQTTFQYQFHIASSKIPSFLIIPYPKSDLIKNMIHFKN